VFLAVQQRPGNVDVADVRRRTHYGVHQARCGIHAYVGLHAQCGADPEILVTGGRLHRPIVRPSKHLPKSLKAPADLF
jgi:hypothetical protein